MYTGKRKLSQHELQRIAIVMQAILIFIFVVLLFSFWNIQILKNNYYTTLATQNIQKQIEIKAPRGFILDRHHKRLAENKINFNLFLTREYITDMPRTLKTAAAVTESTEEDINKSIAKYRGYPNSYAIPIKKDLPLSKVIYIESRADQLPEFEISIEPARAYPYDEKASHILGYISELTAQELKKKESQGYKLGDMAGKNGIEKIYERYLRGVNGYRSVVKDNLGKIQDVVGEKKPTIGDSVVLTIDFQLQEFIEKEFAEHHGCVGVVDLKTGGLLAMVSKPNFEPEFLPDPWIEKVVDTYQRSSQTTSQ